MHCLFLLTKLIFHVFELLFQYVLSNLYVIAKYFSLRATTLQSFTINHNNNTLLPPPSASNIAYSNMSHVVISSYFSSSQSIFSPSREGTLYVQMVKSFQEPDILSTPYFFSTTAAPVAEHFRAAGDYKISSGVIISRTELNLEIHAFEKKKTI